MQNRNSKSLKKKTNKLKNTINLSSLVKANKNLQNKKVNSKSTNRLQVKKRVRQENRGNDIDSEIEVETNYMLGVKGQLGNEIESLIDTEYEEENETKIEREVNTEVDTEEEIDTEKEIVEDYTVQNVRKRKIRESEENKRSKLTKKITGKPHF